MGEYTVENSGVNIRMWEDFDSWEEGRGCQVLSPIAAAATQHGEEHSRSCFTINAVSLNDATFRGLF